MSPLTRALSGVLLVLAAQTAAAQELPALTQPVNDFANVVDAESERALDTMIRELLQASGDTVVVVTVPTFQPYADVRSYAVELFENGGRGIGQKGKDNGLLVVLAVNDRQVWVEVGYDLEEFITDGFAGETSRTYMAPEFRRGAYGPGLLAGVSRIVSRIADRRNVQLRGVPVTTVPREPAADVSQIVWVAFILLFIALNAMAGRSRRSRRRWGRGPWSGWHSGVGPFGGGFGGGSGGFGGGFGGFGGGGFGGFGGGRSGGGGGGAGW
jgi:uncharacterized protein